MKEELVLPVGVPEQPQSKPAAMPAVQVQATYALDACLGKGSYGTVYRATVVGGAASGRSVAVKSQKLRSAASEVEALRRLRGKPNIIGLLGTFQGNEEVEQDRTLNIVLEYVPDTLMRIIKHHRACASYMDTFHVRLYAYQLLRGLASMERAGVVHRDIKPANLLVHPTKVLKVCDFGTAMVSGSSEGMTPYLCSRYYRAPELILSSQEYNGAVDLWSAGCVLAEMLLGQPLFAGQNGVDQLHRILEIMGTPTPQELYAMNHQYDAAVDFGCPIPPRPWEKVINRPVDGDALSLLGQILKYDPSARIQPVQAMAAPLFDELARTPAWQVPAGLLSLSEEELAVVSPAVRERLLSRGGNAALA